MLRRTAVVCRLGKPKPAASSRWPARAGTPATRRPHQGGQQFFQKHLLEQANAEAQQRRRGTDGEAAGATGRTMPGVLPTSPFAPSERTAPMDPEQLELLDGFVSKRGYNELEDYERAVEEARRMPGDSSAEASAGLGSGADPSLPPTIRGAAAFEQEFGYSLVKAESFVEPDTPYSRLDLWGEQARYHSNTYFLYLIARRRNAYAVLYDYTGKRMLPVYSAGNRGLKNSDRGFQADGSKENAHAVASQYIADVLPKVYEREIDAGRMRPGESKKIDVVVRVLGFYNGRSGLVRAVKDRSDVLEVRYIEDITPFPKNGPRVPKKMGDS